MVGCFNRAYDVANMSRSDHSSTWRARSWFGCLHLHCPGLHSSHLRCRCSYESNQALLASHRNSVNAAVSCYKEEPDCTGILKVRASAGLQVAGLHTAMCTQLGTQLSFTVIPVTSQQVKPNAFHSKL